MRFEACAVATTVSGLAFVARETKQLVYYKDTSKHCTERRGIARALSNAAKLDACI